MYNNENRISFNISVDEIKQIENWLIEEQSLSKEGFYCRWEDIKSAYIDNRLIAIFDDDKAVGFTTWCSSEYVSRIDYIEIKPTHRKMGFCRKLISHLFEYLKNNNIYVAQLQCSPESSEPIWRKLGFVDFPKGLYDNCINKQLYRILVPHIQFAKDLSILNRIELWNKEPFQSNNIDSIWKWDIEYVGNTSKLILPIIAPAWKDWRIRWVRNGECVKDDKVMKFNYKKPIDFGEFIVIEELN